MLSNDIASFKLHILIDGGENRGDRNGLDIFCLDVGGNAHKLLFVERCDWATIELITASDEVGVVSHSITQISGPVDHRRQALGCWQPQADRSHMIDMFALNHCVGEMGGPDHHIGDLFAVNPRLLDGPFHSFDHTGGDIFGG